MAPPGRWSPSIPSTIAQKPVHVVTAATHPRHPPVGIRAYLSATHRRFCGWTSRLSSQASAGGVVGEEIEVAGARPEVGAGAAIGGIAAIEGGEGWRCGGA